MPQIPIAANIIARSAGHPDNRATKRPQRGISDSGIIGSEGCILWLQEAQTTELMESPSGLAAVFGNQHPYAELYGDLTTDVARAAWHAEALGAQERAILLDEQRDAIYHTALSLGMTVAEAGFFASAFVTLVRILVDAIARPDQLREHVSQVRLSHSVGNARRPQRNAGRGTAHEQLSLTR